MRRDRSEWSSSTIADGKVGRFGRGAGGSGVDRNGEGIGDKRQHDRVGADAAQLLDHQPVDVGEMQPQLGEPIALGPLRLRRCMRCRLFSRICRLARCDISGLLLPQHDMSGNEVADARRPQGRAH